MFTGTAMPRRSFHCNSVVEWDNRRTGLNYVELETDYPYPW
jgi:hypothetical protein